MVIYVAENLNKRINKERVTTLLVEDNLLETYAPYLIKMKKTIMRIKLFKFPWEKLRVDL